MEKDQFLIVNKNDLETMLKELLGSLPLTEVPWVDESECMSILGIKSKTFLWKLRSIGAIRYSMVSKKNFMYFRGSLYEYLESKAQEKF